MRRECLVSLLSTIGQTFVTMNIPQGDPVGAVSIALYSVAIMLTYPLQLFPAIKCMERHLFRAGGQRTFQRTWLKNSLRAATVLFTAVVANYAGSRYAFDDTKNNT